MATPVNATEVMIIRHAEKPEGDIRGVMPDGSHNPEALTVTGWQRSGGLVTLFAPARGPLQNPELATPGTVLASWASAAEGSQRPYQTVAALARELSLDSGRFLTFDKSDTTGVVEAALAATGVALICWQHEGIQGIAGELGRKVGLPVTPVAPSTWPPPACPGARFDVV